MSGVSLSRPAPGRSTARNGVGSAGARIGGSTTVAASQAWKSSSATRYAARSPSWLARKRPARIARNTVFGLIWQRAAMSFGVSSCVVAHQRSRPIARTRGCSRSTPTVRERSAPSISICRSRSSSTRSRAPVGLLARVGAERSACSRRSAGRYHRGRSRSSRRSAVTAVATVTLGVGEVSRDARELLPIRRVIGRQLLRLGTHQPRDESRLALGSPARTRAAPEPRPRARTGGSTAPRD